VNTTLSLLSPPRDKCREAEDSDPPSFSAQIFFLTASLSKKQYYPVYCQTERHSLLSSTFPLLTIEYNWFQIFSDKHQFVRSCQCFRSAGLQISFLYCYFSNITCNCVNSYLIINSLFHNTPSDSDFLTNANCYSYWYQEPIQDSISLGKRKKNLFSD
jgi:hypothetical protein